ncbi:hypothetical protein N5B96_16895 [Acinetobacter johnsonii]|uniref:hypothetical protein n=1 Tax=Acinetobacter johnsonii TaxID=40214 RepID=UPI00244BAA58|nr:hypothetical protein [Acinetobacter johnsonii]MDH1071110.1 hypothetical protein [Acinetobacter johnsonii]
MKISQTTATAVVLFRALDYSLQPLDRFVFFRLWLKYVDREIDMSAPLTLAKEIGIHSVKLRGSIQLLIDKGIVECVSKDTVKIVFLNSDNEIRSKKIIKRQIVVQQHNNHRFRFIYKLLTIIYDVRISHKQSQIDELLKIDYKAWLVLFKLVANSDENGIVLRVGMHELGLYTGMSRHSILRSLDKLFSFGILRSKINGTLDNALLNFTSAIYFINLSHPIWGEYCQYKKYFLIKNPATQNLLVQALDVLNNLDKPELFLSSQIQTLQYIQDLNAFQFENAISALVKYLEEFNFASELSNNFTIKMNISKFRSSIRLKKADNQMDNLKRLEFIFKYVAKCLPAGQLYWSSKIHLFDDLAVYEKISEFKKYLYFNDFESYSDSTSQISKIPKSELVQILETSQLQIYSFITQYLLKNEALHLIDVAQQEFFDIRPIPLAGEVQMSGYISASIRQDQLFIVTFESDGKVYRKVQEEVEMTIENQKLFGLLDQSCTALTF